MYKIHMYHNDQPVMKRRIEHIPRCGDTVRLNHEQYGKVMEVVWCFDESSDEGQRVNIRTETMQEGYCLTRSGFRK